MGVAWNLAAQYDFNQQSTIMKKILNFLATVSVAFFLSFTLGILLTDSLTACLDVTVFGGLLLSLWFGALD